MKNYLKRILPVFLALGLILPGALALPAFAENDVPQPDSIIYQEDFSKSLADLETSENLSLGTDGVSYDATGSSLKMSTSATGGKTAVSLNFLPSAEKITGDYVIEYTLKNPTGTENGHRIYLTGAMYFEWNPNMNPKKLGIDCFIPSRYSVPLEEDYNSYDTDGKTMKVTMRFDTEEGTVKTWFNDVFAWENTFDSADKLKATSFAGISIGLYKGSIELVDVKCYRPKEDASAADARVQAAYDALTEDVLLPAPLTENGYLADDLYLPSLGKKDVDIAWTSSDDNIIDSETGYVTRADAETEVTLTATLSSEGAAPLEKAFTFKIPARCETPDGLPGILNMGYREDFNEKNDKTMTFTPGAVGKIEVKDGVLSFTTSGKSASAIDSRIYLTEDRQAISGEIGIEMVMERASGSEGMQIILGNSETGYLADYRWESNSVQFLKEWNGVRFANQDYYSMSEYGIGNKLKITMIIDTDAGTATMLLNNKVVVENHEIRPGPISFVRLMRDNRILSTTVDNFRFYYLKTDDARAALYDSQELSYDRIFKPAEVSDHLIAYDVNMPQKGMRGSEIKWTSSNPEVISETGEINRPDEDTEVTLTAEVTAGEYSYTAAFTVTVLRGGDGDIFILKKDLDDITLDRILTGSLTGSNLIDADLNLYTKGDYGSDISWTTTNSELIAENGSVTRPENQEGDIYATITATVSNGDYSMEKSFYLGVIPEDYSFENVPLPERYEDFFHSVYTVHTEGEPYNSEETTLVGYNVDDWSPCSCRGWGGRVTEFNGYVELIRERPPKNGDGATDFTYGLNPTGEPIGDLAAVQYSLEKIGTGEIHQQISTSNGVVVLLYWRSDGTFWLRHRNPDGTQCETYTKQKYTGVVNMTVMTDEQAGTFSVWANNDCLLYNAYPYSLGATGIRVINTRIMGTNYLTLKITEYDIFKAYPIAHMRPESDASLITEELIRNGIPAPAKGKLASDLYLPTKGKYGSTITWESTEESLIETNGKVNRPEDWPNEHEVTVTATISYGCFSVKKSFKFNVMPYYTADDTIAEKDEAFLSTDNWNFFTFDDTDFSSVKTSLNLPDKGPYGSTYIWKTSNSKYITETGRVTRPRWDGEPQEVTLTAVIIYGVSVKTREFTFTVQPDEELKDPEHMSDEDFFGVWDGGKWTTVGKLNYAYGKKLGKVETAAKAGDYELAKEELLAYMKARPASFLANPLSRNPSYTESFIVTGMRDSENHNHFSSRGYITSHDYKEHVFPLTDSIIKGAVTSYKISARYNEKSTARVLSSEYPEADKRPRAEVIVNGSKRTYYACGDTTIRGGQYKYMNFSDETEMPVTYFGEFQGDGLSDLLMQFDFSDINKTDDVSEAYLYLYAKLDEDYANEKELVISREGTEWDASSVTMANITEYTFNYNGIPGKDTWRKPGNAESEYILQSPRFRNHCNAAAEYAYTGDEKYAYTVIWDLMDFIIDTQGRFVYSEELKAGRTPSQMDWEVLPNVVRYGAYPRALDMGLKLESIIDMFDILAKSPYMTPDACTAILKNLWHGSDELEKFLTDPVNEGLGANQKVLEAECYMTTAAFMPEFHASDRLIKSSINVMENLMEASFFPDGAYIEGSDGYTSMALNLFISFWKKIRTIGYDYSEPAKELLSKATRYVATLGSNGAVSTVWGDNGKSTPRITKKQQDYYQITHDEITNFINTYGRDGTMPDWTSVLYESNMLAILRSDWTDDGTYIFMPSGNYEPHGHPDGNQIVLNAFQKQLLIDGGYFSYDDSPERKYMKSTRGHNTVEIDNTSQRLVQGVGTNTLVPAAEKNLFVTNKNYDLYSVTSHANKVQQVDHRRTVTFLKPNIVIVSDLMLPEDEEASHNYKQLWHMSNLADLQSDTENRMFYSNFPTGAQIKVASADTDAEIFEEDGYDTENWGVASIARYGYYAKENIQGKETFDTVLLPYRSNGDVLAEHIDLGCDNSDATAMKITAEVDGETEYIYYMLDYDHEAGAVHTFGDYKTDAELAVIRTTESGKVKETIMYNGSYIKEKGTTLLSSEDGAEYLSCKAQGNTAELFASSDVKTADVTVYTEDNIKNVIYNGKSTEFDLDGKTLKLTGKDSEEVLENDPNSGKGGVRDNESSGGSGGSGGGNSGGNNGGNNNGGNTDNSVIFTDIAGHWAEDSIIRMAKQGIVKGYGTVFIPDGNITRAELVTMVVRVLNLDTSETDTGFEDVPSDSWFAPYIKAALDKGIIAKDTVFRPNDNITREEMSKILSLTNTLLTDTEMTTPDDFSTAYADEDVISDWAKPYVAYASCSGLMKGMDDGRFAPKENATRAQATTVLDRILK